ncbi:SH3 domain-containing protein [Bacillus cereus group sp. BfR-BA-01446]|uniref:SH3 domain-containing protein n=1 Tax=Bacillus cereus group sp. BfR-BA-01446 TaxID=2920350 RepID=UPI001F5784CE|nr:SH3 domain-containing protein [Bacillus cereus group sp. BfR-BA-01446]
MKYIVIKSHVSNYPDPIRLEEGDVVKMIESYDGPENWENWMFCHEEKYDRKGWVPEQIIRKDMNGTGIIIKQYTAKELNVSIGERVIALEELNGWIWCEKTGGEDGWVPKENLQNISNTIWLLI